MSSRRIDPRQPIWLPLILACAGLAAGPAGVTAGPRQPSDPQIRQVEFVGNQFFADRDLERWMRQRPSGFLYRSRYQPAELLQDLERLRRLYIGEGFLEVAIDAEVDSSRLAQGAVDLHVVVAEGSRWRLLSRELVLEGTNASSALADTILGGLEMQVPGPYRLRALVTDRDRIDRLLASSGLLDSRVEATVARDDSCRTARLRLRVTTGPRARLRDVQVRGRLHTRSELIRRELALREGELLRPPTLAAARENLLRTGLFSRVEVSLAENDAGKADKTVVLSLREFPAGSLGGGAGYGTSDHARLSLALEHRNVTGRGIRAALRGVYGERRRGGEVECNLPWTLGRRVATTFAAQHERLSPPSYAVERSGGSVHLSRQLERIWRIHFGYETERIHFLRGTDGKRAGHSERLGQLSTRLTRDSRDELFLPSRGAYTRLEVDWNSPLFGSQHHFVRTEGEHRAYLAVGPLVASTRLRQGWIAPQDDARPVPITERYFAGGLETIRGFPEGDVGPSESAGRPAGGRLLSLAAGEVRLGIYRGLTGSGFVDAGQLTDRGEFLTWRSISVGAGLSVQAKVPVGRVRLSIAWPLTSRYGDDAQFYVGSGSSF